MIIREPDTITRLRPLASGDLDGDGRPELLVEAVCNGTEGTWVDIRLLVLARAGDTNEGFAYRLVESIAP